MKRSRNTRVYASIPKLRIRAAKKTQYDESDNNIKETVADDVETTENDVAIEIATPEYDNEETAEDNDTVTIKTMTPEYDDVRETAEDDDMEETDKELESSSERMSEVSI